MNKDSALVYSLELLLIGYVLVKLFHYSYLILLFGLPILYLFWYLSKESDVKEFQTIFKNNNLYKGSEFPKCKKIPDESKEMTYTFSLPAGLSFSDYKKYESAISEHFGKKALVERCDPNNPATFRVTLSLLETKNEPSLNKNHVVQ